MAPCCSITDTFDISLRDLVDYYFVPLKACIDIADVGAFMCSCALISPLTPLPPLCFACLLSLAARADNAINGTATCGDQWLNVDVVRNTWK